MQSELGRGTTFEVYLPCVTAPDADCRADGTQAATCDAQGSLSRLGGRTILVVEDESAVRKLTTRILRDEGCTVLAVPNGPRAIGLAQDEFLSIDLLLTYVVLPGGIQGDEVARRVVELRPRLPWCICLGTPAKATWVHAASTKASTTSRSPLQPRRSSPN
jgi:two-component system, cell cycle sensor histidine kinase and response regulator CckA